MNEEQHFYVDGDKKSAILTYDNRILEYVKNEKESDKVSTMYDFTGIKHKFKSREEALKWLDDKGYAEDENEI